MKRTLPFILVWTFGMLFTGSLAAAPLVQLTGPAEWKAWRVAGNWQWTGEWVGGAGTGTWQYAEVGDASWKNYRVDLSLRLDAATTRLEPKWEGDNFHSYRNHQNIAGYEAGLAVRKAGDEMYRIMFSLPFQEVMLWSSRGGFLQVVPLKMETGKVYQVTALAQGPHIEVTVDQQTVIDYWERHGVLTTGGVALALYEGTGVFSKVTVSSMPAFAGQVPMHVADLRFRDWKGARWAWDGNEPIFYVGNDCIGHQLKLVPGWRAQMNSWWHWLNYGTETFYQDKLTDFKVLEEGSKLRFLVVGTDKKEKTWLTGRCEVTVTYDPARGVYVHDTTSDLIIAEGHSLKVSHPVEFTDPVLFGHVGSASSHASWETPHPWSVYKHVSGKLYKLPHNHAGWYPGFGDPPWQQAKGGYLDPQGGFWALVGDPVANPVLSVQGSSAPGSEFYTELCGWAFDVHMRWYPVKSGGTLPPGTNTVKWRLTSVDGKQGDAWLKEAEFCAPGDLNKTLLLYTAGIGEPEKFNTVVKWATPFYMYPWGDGSLQDTTVGHGDKTSLRLVGPRSAGSVVGGSVFNDPVLKNTDYEVSVWVKMSAPSKAGVNNPDNRGRSKPNQQTGTEHCASGRQRPMRSQREGDYRP
ncbi:MAG: hypothetical protein L6437_08230 [Kiritimatiellae bacterium]|nr:hypothetical protein [Kiritimatiellia bacterium]